VETLYPDAKASYTCMVGRKLSWTTVNTLDLVEPLTGVLSMNKRIAESFKSLLKPPQFGAVDIQNALFSFITSLPDYIPAVKHDKTFELFKSVRRLLKSAQCVQLYGLLIHFSYWNVIHPTVRHTIQTLRNAQPSGEDVTFRDVDLAVSNGLLQLRSQGNTAAGAMRPTTGAPRSSMTVEKMFTDEVFDSQDGAEVWSLDVPSSGKFGSGESARLRSRSTSPVARKISPGGEVQLSPPSSRPGSRAPSPLMREITGLFEQPAGSRKVAFGVLASVEVPHNGKGGAGSRPGSRAASPNRQLQDAEGLAEDRRDGSPSNSPLRSRGLSFMSGLGGGGFSSKSFVGEVTEDEYGDTAGTMLGGTMSVASVETEASLSAAEKEQLFMQLEVCLVGLFKQVLRNFLPCSADRA
jgi:hypothetical protein